MISKTITIIPSVKTLPVLAKILLIFATLHLKPVSSWTLPSNSTRKKIYYRYTFVNSNKKLRNRWRTETRDFRFTRANTLGKSTYMRKECDRPSACGAFCAVEPMTSRIDNLSNDLWDRQFTCTERSRQIDNCKNFSYKHLQLPLNYACRNVLLVNSQT